MNRDSSARFLFSTIHKILFLMVAVGLVFACVSSEATQKDKKKKKDEAPADTKKLLIPMTDEQQIDYMLSEMLGAWQLNDIEKMHAKYADDVIIVNGAWAPPVIGWTNYAAIYQQQRAHMQQVRLERSNTYVKVSGNVGWACYQWEFSGLVDGQQVQSFGHTTVVVQSAPNTRSSYTTTLPWCRERNRSHPQIHHPLSSPPNQEGTEPFSPPQPKALRNSV